MRPKYHLSSLSLMLFEVFHDGCVLDIEIKNFSNSQSPYCPDASHQVSVQSNIIMV